MAFNYDILKSITNQDFASRSRNLLPTCEEIERKFSKGDYKGCCSTIRTETEAILRYLYDRLIGIKDWGKSPTAGKILQDEQFKSKLGDELLCYKAGEIQRTASKFSAHRDRNPSETLEQYEKRIQSESEAEPYVAKDLMSDFSMFLECSINYINKNLSSVRGKLSINMEKRINPDTGRDESMLLANLQDVVNRREYTYRWKVKESNSIIATRTYRLRLNQEWMKGHIIVLEARREDGTQEPLVAEIGPIGSSDIILEKSGQSINDKPRLEGKITTKLISENGLGKYLEASVESSPCEGPFYYTWYAGEEELIKGWKKSKLYIQGKDLGVNQAIYCSVSAEGWRGIIKGDPCNLGYVSKTKDYSVKSFDEVEVPTKAQRKDRFTEKDASSFREDKKVLDWRPTEGETKGKLKDTSNSENLQTSLIAYDVEAMVKLGDIAYNARDSVTAINWYIRAIKNGDHSAREKYDAVCKEELEVRVGESIAAGLSKDKLAEVDAIEDHKAVMKWLEINRPDYKQIVETEAMKMWKEFGYVPQGWSENKLISLEKRTTYQREGSNQTAIGQTNRSKDDERSTTKTISDVNSKKEPEKLKKLEENKRKAIKRVSIALAIESGALLVAIVLLMKLTLLANCRWCFGACYGLILYSHWRIGGTFKEFGGYKKRDRIETMLFTILLVGVPVLFISLGIDSFILKGKTTDLTAFTTLCCCIVVPALSTYSEVLFLKENVKRKMAISVVRVMVTVLNIANIVMLTKFFLLIKKG